MEVSMPPAEDRRIKCLKKTPAVAFAGISPTPTAIRNMMEPETTLVSPSFVSARFPVQADPSDVLVAHPGAPWIPKGVGIHACEAVWKEPRHRLVRGIHRAAEEAARGRAGLRRMSRGLVNTMKPSTWSTGATHGTWVMRFGPAKLGNCWKIIRSKSQNPPTEVEEARL